MRAEVDVLTLSATPIPRTLHMALAGVRDMSVIHTPPEARLPVRTFISEDSGELVREAILREIERDGQVFFLHKPRPHYPPGGRRAQQVGSGSAGLGGPRPDAGKRARGRDG